MVLVTKSMPTVGWVRAGYVGGEFEGVVDEAGDDGGFAYILVSHEDYLKLAQFRHIYYFKLSASSFIDL